MSKSWEDDPSVDAFGEGTPEGPKVPLQKRFGLASGGAGQSRPSNNVFDHINLQPAASGGKYLRTTGASGSAHTSAVRSRIGVRSDAPEERVSTGDDESNLILIVSLLNIDPFSPHSA
jgi:hypothetical protein